MIRDYYIAPARKLPKDLVQQYWQTLYSHNTLRFRLCDVEDPTWTDVEDMLKRSLHMYHVVRLTTDGLELVAEFALEGFTGKAAQAHFSMHPENTTRYSIDLMRDVSNLILREWRNELTNENYLDSLYGLTPTTNRVACIFVQKGGFKKIGILPSGIRDRGKIVDAMITIRTPEEA